MKTTKKIITLFLVIAIQQSTLFAFADGMDDTGSWNTNVPSYDTGSWNTNVPSYDTGSWNTNVPSYDTGSWNTNVPSYDTGSWNTNVPSYDTGSWNTNVPSYDTGSWNTNVPSYDTGSWNTNVPSYDTGSWNTNVPSYDSGTWNSTTVSPTGSYDIGTWNTTTSYPNGVYMPSGVYTPSYSSYPTTYGAIGYGTTAYGSTGYGTSYGSVYTSTPSVVYPTTSWTGYTTPSIITTPTVITTPTTPIITTIPTVTTTRCSDGSFPVNGSCTRTNTIPVVTNTICADGQAPINGSCVRTTTLPVTTVTQCPSNTNFVNGVCQQIINPPVITYQTCWDGSRIPATQTCAQQFKFCPNGTSIPVYQQCPQAPVVIPPPVVKFNNVVTSVVTEVTINSARCNGIGLIANGAQSTGWFEYGETANLGRTTASAQIGSASTVNFSNVLANLKPATKYYCRAVMQNQYGLVKGEIVSFVTKSKAVTYVKPVTVTKTIAKKPVVKKNEVVCVDGSIVTTTSQSSATMLQNGEKLVSLQLEKVSGNLSSESTVTYKLTYKNLSDVKVNGVIIKVTIPQEIEFTSTSAGSYDIATHTLTLNLDSIEAGSTGTLTWTGKVTKNAPIGKSIVTTSYVNYTVPGSNTQDEVTAYVVGSIATPATSATTDTGAKKVIGGGSGLSFLPDTLIEWLALIAIVFIIFILAKSVYASYKDDKKSLV
ncbi:MAG: fibronectin type protein [Candidatus Nomurabacteria bacterium]|nr:fibronectin type protein [Candidatus Nomurabacteria bacterium]